MFVTSSSMQIAILFAFFLSIPFSWQKSPTSLDVPSISKMLSAVIVDLRTGLKSDRIYVARLNKEFTIDYVLNLSFDLDISIGEVGENFEEIFYSVKTLI